MSELKSENIKEVAKQKPVAEETVFVSIPETDIFDSQHPTVQLNQHKFEAGKTYQVPTVVGGEIEDRLQKFHKESVRLLRPKIDSKSITQVNTGSAWARKGGGIVGSDNVVDSAILPTDKVYQVKW